MRWMLIKTNSLMILFLAFMSTVFAQAPDTMWTRTFHYLDHNRGMCHQQTNDDGAVIAGYSLNNNSELTDIFVTRTDGDGDTLWSRMYGDSLQYMAFSIKQTEDQGYIVAGSARVPLLGATPDIYIMKLDGNGDSVWTRSYLMGSAYSVELTDDGGYIIAGYRGPYWLSGLFLMKCDANGDSLWSYTRDLGFNSTFESIVQTSEGYYIAVGWTTLYLGDSYDIVIAAVDTDGDSLWSKIYGFGGPGGDSHDQAFCIQELNDNSFAVSGVTSRDYVPSALLMKINGTGDTIWTRQYLPSFSDYNEGHWVDQTADGGFILAGYSTPHNNLLSDWLIIRTDVYGDTVWTMRFGEDSFDDYACLISQTSDGGYLVSGVSRSDNWGSDCLLMKIESDITSNNNDETPEIAKSLSIVQNYPNPFNAQTTIKFTLPEARNVQLTIYDLLGRRIQTLINEYRQAGSHTITFDASGLTSGVYLLRLQAGDVTKTKSMVLLK